MLQNLDLAGLKVQGRLMQPPRQSWFQFGSYKKYELEDVSTDHLPTSDKCQAHSSPLNSNHIMASLRFFVSLIELNIS